MKQCNILVKVCSPEVRWDLITIKMNFECKTLSKLQAEASANLPSRNKTLVIAANNCGETDIKVFWSFLFMLDFFTVPIQFFLGLYVSIEIGWQISWHEIRHVAYYLKGSDHKWFFIIFVANNLYFKYFKPSNKFLILIDSIKFHIDWSFLHTTTLKISFVVSRRVSEPRQTSKIEYFADIFFLSGTQKL